MQIGLYTSAMLMILAATPVLAEAPPTDAGRYRLEKTETGFIRLDRQTGAITFCREKDGELICRMAADERAAYDQELDMLARRVTALEARLDRLASGNRQPSEAEIEQSLSIMERVMRRFMALVEEFRQNDAVQPNRG
ncbi:hypothetical protein [Rhizobium sp. SGZ-381]|uniref:hypothetical protein n=1 Tax=Rhizobium sp. SGZ-381 TaxID=3342800 RepID=UPI00366D4C9B